MTIILRARQGIKNTRDKLPDLPQSQVALRSLLKAHADRGFRKRLTALPRDPSTIDDEEMANDKAGLIGTQEHHRGCQFLGFAHPAFGHDFCRRRDIS